MATVLDLITASMRWIGAIASGDTPSPAEGEDAMTMLNDVIEALSLEGLPVLNDTEETLTLTAGTAAYTWGTAGTIATARPVEIVDNCFIRESSIDYRVRVRSLTWYRRLSLKGTAARPTGLALQPAFPLATVYFYPTPIDSHAVHVRTKKVMTTYTDLTTILSLAPGYYRLLKFLLALDLAPEYEQEITAAKYALAEKAKNTIMAANLTIEPTDTDPFRASEPWSIEAG